MKKIILTLSLGLITLVTVHAQDVNTVNQPTWVVESENANAKVQTVKFYDSNAQLIYAETVNTKLNISRKKIQKALNQLLNNLLTQQGYRENKNLLTASLKLKN
ncbi:hypothetical protein [Mucilaginibacter aquatilis]|uniref:Uncharacterized protein n=1 Tax=Mucilaginibacter aquatilis TaxID=1517760 RepID=A0A6I4IPK8_9SPHI|nr:hypothetical protein [Mucilaginibacter aquatilis]MVN90183.1 hypothetical protein [Mucilaginibacter aquatilis]